jgi:hypothetical protein
MFFTLDEILKGNAKLLNWYNEALNLWKDILKPYDLTDSSQFGKLSKVLFENQFKFESICGSRSIGKEIMAVSAIVQFYNINTGFDDEWDKPSEHRKKKAKNLFNAIQFSGCSLEVKSNAKRIAKIYGLIES